MAAACFLAAFLVVAAINWIELIPWRKSVGAHWTERSRILWPVRKSQAILVLYLPVLITAASSLVFKSSLVNLIPLWLAASAGAMGAGWFGIRQLYPGAGLRPWLHDVAVAWALRSAFWLVLLVAGFSMPDKFNLRVWLTLSGVVLLQVAWLSMTLQMLRWFHIIRPPGERLMKIVAGCTKEGGPRVRGLWQAGGLAANAFALPLSGTLVFFDRLLDLLNDDEVAAVCAHELGHLAESKPVLAARYFGAMAILPLLLVKPAAHQWEFPGFLAMLLLMIFWSRLSRKLVHRLETRADEVASSQQAGDGVYAKALEKIYQANHLPAVMPEKLSTHPDLYDRMLAAGVTPGFPRPFAPREYTVVGWCMLFAGPFILMWILSDAF